MSKNPVILTLLKSGGNLLAMGNVERGTPISCPKDFSGHIVENPPTVRQVNTGIHQSEPVFIAANDQFYFFSPMVTQSSGKNHDLYFGKYMLTNSNHDFTDIGGDAYLLILNNDTPAHEAELWIKEKQS